MNGDVIQIVRAREIRLALGQRIRLTRQRLGLTQSLLASKSVVSAMTVSRLEREGQGAVDHLLRVLQALCELDGFHAHVHGLLQKSSLPQNISELQRLARPRQRVRLRKPPQGPS
ncbi:MAG: helix-turn-helix domain-containing protein [Verrucomicrobiae bacterium]|nr:helix-turn-helix domain-containing protein [Verrucomicrobiae bacterium]